MRKLKKLLKGFGSKGFSLVELIISAAIMGVVATTVAGAMYVSSKSYTRGAAEVNVQEEAQVAMNLISDWVMDATAVNSSDPTSLEITHPDEDATIIISVFQSGTDLMYHTSVDATNRVLCSNLTASGVHFNSTFDTDRNVNVSLDFDINGRTYHAVTDTTSRNHDFTLNSTGSDMLNLVVPDNTIVLEPAMNGTASYTFDAVVYGAASAPVITVTDQSGDISATAGTVTAAGSSVYTCVITVSSTNQAIDAGSFKLNASFTDSEGNAHTDTEVVTTLVRRATKCVYLTSDKTYLDPVSGTAGMAGSVYLNTVDLGLQNAAPRTNAAYDSGTTFGYIDPSKVEFYLRYADGTDVPSSVYTITSVDHGVPNVAITLNSDISKDINVYVSSIHSGSNSITGTVAENKATRITGTAKSYTTGGSAYTSYFVIKKGGNPDIVDIGAGFQRGANAFVIGRLSDARASEVNTFKSTLPTVGSDPNNIGNWRYVVSFRYKVLGAPDSSYSNTVILNITNASENVNDWNTWGNSSNGSNGQYITEVFDCDKAYTLEVSFDLINISTGVVGKHFTSYGNINSCEQYVYDQNSDKYTSAVGTDTNPVVIDRNDPIIGTYGGINNFYVYYDSLNVVNTDLYKFGNNDTYRVVEKYNETTHTWESGKTFNVQGVQDLSFGDYITETVNTYGWVHDVNTRIIHFDGSADKKVGNFDQNQFPDTYVTVLQNEIGAFQHTDNGSYRITYYTQSNGTRYSVSNYGTMPSAGNAGSVYSMSGSNNVRETLGTVYFDVKNF